MGQFVIDVFINSIIYAEDDEIKTNKYSYKIVSQKKLRDIGNENYKKILKIIKENNADGYYHLSMKPMTNFIDTSFKGTTYFGKTNLYYNPVGLYMSCGKNYYDVDVQKAHNQFVDKSIYHSYIYELKVSKTVLKIKSLKSFVNFINKYKYSNSKIKITDILNWKQIKKEYDGLIICPILHEQLFGDTLPLLDIYKDENIIQEKILEKYGENWKKELRFLSEWFRGWRTQGVIWRETGLKQINLIDKLNIL